MVLYRQTIGCNRILYPNARTKYFQHDVIYHVGNFVILKNDFFHLSLELMLLVKVNCVIHHCS